jgi:hypothetical protein
MNHPKPTAEGSLPPSSDHDGKLSIWFNDGHPIIAEIVTSLWLKDFEQRTVDRLIRRIVVTSQDPFFPGFEQASFAQVEAEFESSDNYVDWALDFAHRNHINCMFPGRNAKALIAREKDFRNIGVTLLYSCSPGELEIIDDRPSLYQRLEQCFHSDIVPDCHKWCDDRQESLETAVTYVRANLRDVPVSMRSVCVMPAAGKIRKGFYRFVDKQDPEQMLERPGDRMIRIADFSDLAGLVAERSQQNKQWVVMGFMPGPSYSVDCLAWRGEVVASVIREKQDKSRGHLVIDNAHLVRQAAIIARDFGLSGIFNAKFRVDARGRIKLLSVNPRFFGGMGMSILAGVNLPWLWLKLHKTKGRYASDMPKPTLGLRMDSVLCSVHVPDYTPTNKPTSVPEPEQSPIA